MARNGPQAPSTAIADGLSMTGGVVAAFLVCDDLQPCCSRVILLFVMGPLGAAVLNTSFFARSGVGYPETKQKDSSFLCKYR